MSGSLADMTWTEVSARPGLVLALPLGSCEQHGPHLPLGTDTAVATEVARRAAALAADMVVGPALSYGASGEHAGFPGTLSMGTEVLRAALVEIVRSADHFAATVVVSAHGGNAEAVAGALRVLSAEGRRVLAWTPRPAPVDAHAGRSETSLILALSPGAVRDHEDVAGNPTPVDRLWPALRSGGVAAVSPTGVLGRPAGADASEGERLLDAWGANLAADVEQWLAASVRR